MLILKQGTSTPTHKSGVHICVRKRFFNLSQNERPLVGDTGGGSSFFYNYLVGNFSAIPTKPKVFSQIISLFITRHWKYIRSEPPFFFLFWRSKKEKRK
jgi:hypothetical protein